MATNSSSCFAPVVEMTTLDRLQGDILNLSDGRRNVSLGNCLGYTQAAARDVPCAVYEPYQSIFGSQRVYVNRPQGHTYYDSFVCIQFSNPPSTNNTNIWQKGNWTFISINDVSHSLLH